MTLTRKSLKAMGIEDEKIEQIIEDHSETVDALKKQRDDYEAQACKVPELEKKIQELENSEGDDYKAKYEAERDAFEAYKADVEATRKNDQVKNLYRELLKESGIDEKRIETVLKVTDLAKLEINKDGSLRDAEKLKEGIKEDWSDFIATTENRGANVETPPASTGGKMTKDEILAIKDAGERQAAMADNHELFGF